MTLRVIPRTEWGARTSTLGPALDLPTDWLGLHHTVMVIGDQGPPGIDDDDLYRYMRRIDDEGANRPDLAGRFPYSFTVLAPGIAGEGQGWRFRGAHTEGHNYGYGIALPGNHDVDPVEDWEVDVVRDLIALGLASGHLLSGPAYPTTDHQGSGVPTACAGRFTRARMADFRQPSDSLTTEDDDMPKLTADPERPTRLVCAGVRVPSGKKAYLSLFFRGRVTVSVRNDNNDWAPQQKVPPATSGPWGADSVAVFPLSYFVVPGRAFAVMAEPDSATPNSRVIDAVVEYL